MPPEDFGAEAFAAATGVSHETLERVKLYVGLLEDWNSRHNLVSQASLAQVWHRHVYDSAQLAPLVPPEAKTLADLGSGAGFPGLVLAMLLPHLKITLFEATHKKAEFLQTVAARLALPVAVRACRIEAAPHEAFDVVTARACAPLPELFAYAQNLTGPRTVCLFLKGQNSAAELTQARKSWKMKLQEHPSKTHPFGVILEIRDLAHGRS
jgi:16S rRNA (guanine527-N7)-methyltransferase